MKTNALALIAFSAALAFGHVAQAQTLAKQLAEQNGISMGTEHDPGSPLVLEYKLGTHVEAISRKYGQLDQAVKRCRLEGSYFEEDSLADLIGGNLTTSTVPIAKRSYREGQNLDTPPCDRIAKFVNRTLEQVERHRVMIEETSNALSWAKIKPRQETPTQTENRN